MKRILTIIPGLGMGGAEHMAYELIQNLDKNKYTSIVLCYGTKKDTSLEKKMEALCEVKYLNISKSIGPLEMIRVMRAISLYKPDIIHAHMGGIAFAIPWCRLFKKPLVLTVHTRPDKAFSTKNQKQIRYFFKTGRLTMVAVSKENYELIKEYYGIEDDRIQYVNNGIKVERFFREKHDGFAYINVARQDENKNQVAIIRSFARLYEQNNNIRLYLIGDGPDHTKLLELVAELNLESVVKIPGISDSPEKYYALSDVYIQSSHREAMPLSVLEALAAGLPIISTDVGGLKDVVKENGILIPDGSDEALYESMLKLLYMEKQQFSKMILKSKEIAKLYSAQTMAEKYSLIYEKVMTQEG